MMRIERGPHPFTYASHPQCVHLGQAVDPSIPHSGEPCQVDAAIPPIEHNKDLDNCTNGGVVAPIP